MTEDRITIEHIREQDRRERDRTELRKQLMGWRSTLTDDTSRETARQVLDLPVTPNYAQARTVREYLIELLSTVWAQGERFDGKRALGDSDWGHELLDPLATAGLVETMVDRWDDTVIKDRPQAERLIAAAIKELGTPPPDPLDLSSDAGRHQIEQALVRAGLDESNPEARKGLVALADWFYRRGQSEMGFDSELFTRAKGIAARIKYKPTDPHCYILSAAFDHHGVFFQAEADRPDTNTGEWGHGLGGKVYLDPEMTDFAMIRIAFGVLKSYEEHEAREGFLVDGERIFGPHISPAALARVARELG